MVRQLGIWGILLCFTILPLSAQDSGKYEKYKKDEQYVEGFIVDRSGIRIEGLIRASESDNLYKRVTFIFPDGEKKVFRPAKLQSFQLGRAHFYSDGKRFLELVEEGQKADLYRIKERKNSYSNFSDPMMGRAPVRVHDRRNAKEIVYYIKKEGDDSYHLVDDSRFHKKFSRYFEDCPKLSDRILFRELTRSHIKIIVQIYNEQCN